MRLDLRIHKKLPSDLLRPVVEHRARFALTRFSHEIDAVTVALEQQSARDGGEYQCRVTGTLRRGGVLNAQVADPRAANAVGRALARFRRSLLRRTERRTTRPRDSSSAAIA